MWWHLMSFFKTPSNQSMANILLGKNAQQYANDQLIYFESKSIDVERRY